MILFRVSIQTGYRDDTEDRCTVNSGQLVNTVPHDKYMYVRSQRWNTHAYMAHAARTGNALHACANNTCSYPAHNQSDKIFGLQEIFGL